MAKFVRQGMAHPIRWRIHVYKKHDRHTVYPLAQGIQQVSSEVAGNDHTTIAFKQFNHVGDRAARQHPRFSDQASGVLGCERSLASSTIFIAIYFRDEAIRSPRKRNKQFREMHPPYIHFSHDPRERFGG